MTESWELWWCCNLCFIAPWWDLMLVKWLCYIERMTRASHVTLWQVWGIPWQDCCGIISVYSWRVTEETGGCCNCCNYYARGYVIFPHREQQHNNISVSLLCHTTATTTAVIFVHYKLCCERGTQYYLHPESSFCVFSVSVTFRLSI